MIYYTYLQKPSYLEGNSFRDELNLLSDKEKEQFDKLVHHKKIEKVLVLKSASRIISSVLNSKPERYRLKKFKTGKPYIKDLNSDNVFYVSYSHSKKSVAFGFSKNTDLGLDLESIERFKSHRGFHKWLHVNEKEEFLEKKFDPVALAHIWTRKEAITKLTALGYKFNFKSIRVFPENTVEYDNRKIVLSSHKIQDEILSVASYDDVKSIKRVSV